MPTVSLVARRTILYAGQTIVPGECFDARTWQDAHLLTATGAAQSVLTPVTVITNETTSTIDVWDSLAPTDDSEPT